MSIITIMAGVIFFYFKMDDGIRDAQNISRDNNMLLKEILMDRKDEKKVFDATIENIRQNQEALGLRLTVLETQLKAK